MINFLKWIEKEYENECSYVNNNGKRDFLVWSFNVYKENEVKTYDILKIFDENEEGEEINIEWQVNLDMDTPFVEDFERIDEDYSFEKWNERYGNSIEKNKDVINFLEENEGNIFKEE